MKTLDLPKCLETERLWLRAPSPEDGPALHAALVDSLERLRPWFAWADDTVLSPEKSEVTACYAAYRFSEGKVFEFYLFPKGGDALIGVCGLCRPDPYEPDFELSYWLRTGYEGQGYMLEAATAVVDFAFSHLKLPHIGLQTDTNNLPSVALAQRLGFELKEDSNCALVFTRQNENQLQYT